MGEDNKFIDFKSLCSKKEWSAVQYTQWDDIPIKLGLPLSICAYINAKFSVPNCMKWTKNVWLLPLNFALEYAIR
jgi:hypothetical protein